MSAINRVIYPAATQVPTASLSVGASVVSPGTIQNKEGLVFFDIQDADVMCTLDGSTSPTSSFGHWLQVGEKFTWNAATFATAKFIRRDTTNGRIQYQECAY